MRHWALERDGNGAVRRMLWMGDTTPETSAATLSCGFCGASLPPRSNPGSPRRHCNPEHRRLAYERDHPRLNVIQHRLEFGPTASAVENKWLGRREAMLARLKAGPCRTWDLMLLGGAGFSSRLHELREAGHRIVCNLDEQGAVYQLEESCQP